MKLKKSLVFKVIKNNVQWWAEIKQFDNNLYLKIYLFRIYSKITWKITKTIESQII